MEALNAAEDFDKNVLDGIRSIGRIVHHAVNQAIDRLMIMRDQPRKGLFGTGLQFGHHRRLFAVNPDRAG